MSRINVKETLQQLTAEEKAQLCSGRDFWHTQDIERLGIPKIMMCDGPNGLRKQLGEGDALGINESIETVCYPTASAMASSFDTELMEELGEILGKECQSEDVGMLLGPGVNIKRSPLCGRNFEYLSEDPYLAGKLGSAYIRGLQSQGIAACVKHFACNNQEDGRLSGSSEVDERTLREIYLPAFEMAVKEGKTRAVMCAYNAINGVFCAENKRLLHDILREEWGYQGMVVTDWGAVKNRVSGLLAGLDLEMPGSTSGKTEKILEAIGNGTLSEETLNAAVENVLCFVNDALEVKKDGNSFVLEGAERLAGHLEEECAVLLKNDGILPLQKEKKVAMIGPFFENPRYQGAGSSHIHVRHVVSAAECVSEWNVVYAKGCSEEAEMPEAELLSEAVEAARASDVAVIFAGLPESYETEGCDRENMSIPEGQNCLIQEIAKVQENVVVVLHGGSAVEMPWINDVRAVLCMHLGGSHVGAATVSLLTGKANPCGKLAESWPVHLEDNPSYLNFPGDSKKVKYNEELFVGYRYYDKKKLPVNFCFGHGLSYTEFQYSDLSLDKELLTEKDMLTVRCRVKNVGKVFGKEAVQLYVSRPDSKVRRPVKELKGFVKIGLNPGEEKEVTFDLNPRDFAYYETAVGDWVVDSGSLVVSVGSSSRDIRLTGRAQIRSAMCIPIVFTRYSTIGELMESPRGMAVIKGILGGESTEETEQTDAAMGGGAKKMRRQMMFDMPLNSLVSYGRMSDEALDGLLAELNG